MVEFRGFRHTPWEEMTRENVAPHAGPSRAVVNHGTVRRVWDRPHAGWCRTQGPDRERRQRELSGEGPRSRAVAFNQGRVRPEVTGGRGSPGRQQPCLAILLPPVVHAPGSLTKRKLKQRKGDQVSRGQGRVLPTAIPEGPGWTGRHAGAQPSARSGRPRLTCPQTGVGAGGTSAHAAGHPPPGGLGVAHGTRRPCPQLLATRTLIPHGHTLLVCAPRRQTL